MRYHSPQVLHKEASATGYGAKLEVSGYSCAAIVVTGTFVATITWQGTVDGQNWSDLLAYNPTTGDWSTTAIEPGTYIIPTVGLQDIRAAVAWTSGTSVTIIGSVSDVPLSLPTSVAVGEVIVGEVQINDGDDATQGSTADEAVTDPEEPATVIAALKGQLTQLQAIVDSLTDGTAKVQVYGSLPPSMMELAVNDWSELPDPTETPKGATAQLIGTFDVRQNTGTEWVEVVL